MEEPGLENRQVLNSLLRCRRPSSLTTSVTRNNANGSAFPAPKKQGGPQAAVDTNRQNQQQRVPSGVDKGIPVRAQGGGNNQTAASNNKAVGAKRENNARPTGRPCTGMLLAYPIEAV